MNEQKTWHDSVSGSLSWQKVIQKKKFYELCVDCRRQQMELFANAFSRWRLNMTDPNYLTPLRGQILDCLASIDTAYNYTQLLDWLGDDNDLKTVLNVNPTAKRLFGWNIATDTVVGSTTTYRMLRDAMITAPDSVCRYIEFKGVEAMKFGVVFEGEDFKTNQVMRVMFPCDQGMWLSVMASVVGEYRSFAGNAAEGIIEELLGRSMNYSYNNQTASYVHPLAYDSSYNYTTVLSNAVEAMLAAVTDGWSSNSNMQMYCEWFLRYYSLLDSFYTAMASVLNDDMSQDSIKKTARNWVLSNIRNNCLWGNYNSKFLNQFNQDVGLELIVIDD